MRRNITWSNQCCCTAAIMPMRVINSLNAAYVLQGNRSICMCGTARDVVGTCPLLLVWMLLVPHWPAPAFWGHQACFSQSQSAHALWRNLLQIQHPALQSSLLRNNEQSQKGRAAIYLDSAILSCIQLSGRASVLLISAWISHINVEILSHQIMAVYAIHQKYLLLMLFTSFLVQPWHAVTVTTTAVVMLLRCLSGTR